MIYPQNATEEQKRLGNLGIMAGEYSAKNAFKDNICKQLIEKLEKTNKESK